MACFFVLWPTLILPSSPLRLIRTGCRLSWTSFKDSSRNWSSSLNPWRLQQRPPPLHSTKETASVRTCTSWLRSVAPTVAMTVYPSLCLCVNLSVNLATGTGMVKMICSGHVGQSLFSLILLFVHWCLFIPDGWDSGGERIGMSAHNRTHWRNGKMGVISHHLFRYLCPLGYILYLNWKSVERIVMKVCSLSY